MKSLPPIVPSQSPPPPASTARKASATSSAASSSCALCEGSNLAAVCAVCVNQRLGEYYQQLRGRHNVRESFNSRLATMIDTKRKTDEQQKFLVNKKEEVKKLKDRLSNLEKQLSQEKCKFKEATVDLRTKKEMLSTAFAMLKKKREELEKTLPNEALFALELGVLVAKSSVTKKICKLFPMRQVNVEGDKDGYNGRYDQICNARLPRGLDPHSVPPVELAASLGYMVQLLNLVIPVLGAPALHNSGFAGSCSRIWQRQSYWNARPPQSKDYPLFISKQDLCSEENLWAEKGSNDFGVASVNSEISERKPFERSNSLSLSSLSTHTSERHRDLQRGISLLKKSVACITAYCYNSLGLEVPSDASTFEAFRMVLAILVSAKDQSTILSSVKDHKLASASKTTISRFAKELQQLNGSIWSHYSGTSPHSSLIGGAQAAIMPYFQDNDLFNSESGLLYPSEINEHWKSRSLAEGWDIVEHELLPPPPSEVEDVEHWTRAMIIDANKK